MGKKNFLVGIAVFVVGIMLAISFPSTSAAKPIVIGAPLSLNYVYGWDARRGMTLAIEEINAKGGVNVGGKMRPFKLEVLETRDLEPAYPSVRPSWPWKSLFSTKGRILLWGVPFVLRREWRPRT